MGRSEVKEWKRSSWRGERGGDRKEVRSRWRSWDAVAVAVSEGCQNSERVSPVSSQNVQAIPQSSWL
jgi:hypothetical protein